MRIRVLIIWTFLMFGCRSSSSPVGPKLGEEFSLKVGQQITLDYGRAVLAVDSVKDSRCPLDVMCFWSGLATVWCRLSGVPFTLSIYSEAADTSLSNYSVALTSVEPWPISRHIPAQGDYVMKFIVTRDYRMWKRITALTVASHVRGLK